MLGAYRFSAIAALHSGQAIRSRNLNVSLQKERDLVQNDPLQSAEKRLSKDNRIKGLLICRSHDFCKLVAYVGTNTIVQVHASKLATHQDIDESSADYLIAH